MRRAAFTLIEILFVIVILGIVATVGATVALQSYEGYIRAKRVDDANAQTALVLNQIANYMSFRIKSSVIARDQNSMANFDTLTDANASYNILEWIGYDYDSQMAALDDNNLSTPGWSGFIDLDSPNTSTTQASTPGSFLSQTEEIIKILSNNRVDLTNGSGNNRPAIIFKGRPVNDISQYGWGSNHDYTIRVRRDGNSILVFDEPNNPLSSGSSQLYEQYYLAWSAYAIVPTGVARNFNLNLFYNYQPWHGENYNNGTMATLLENVTVFRAIQLGSTIRLKLCVNLFPENNAEIENQSACKEKVVF